ncbi:MAG: 3-dehydroquinate synthase [Planctomycetota bacterium]
MSLTRVQVQTQPPYEVCIGPGASLNWRNACAGADRIALLADAQVYALHAGCLVDLGSEQDLPRRMLPPGESAKSWTLLGETLEFLASAKLSRKSVVLVLGGGAACDHAGLAASLFKRGCGVVHLPTTLLAQVDASVGGKTAINLAAGKNLAGTFHQPRAVLADTNLLQSLPEEELASGLGEVLKTALLGGAEPLAALEANAEALLARDPAALANVVHDCVSIKARVVATDPTERGLRASLNFGHTFAHTIEHVAGYGAIPHGVAVAAGIGMALQAGVRRGSTSSELQQRCAALAANLGLPASLAELRASSGLALEPDALLAGLAHDKKGSVGAPEFVLLDKPGKPVLGVSLAPELLAELFA